MGEQQESVSDTIERARAGSASLLHNPPYLRHETKQLQPEPRVVLSPQFGNYLRLQYTLLVEAIVEHGRHEPVAGQRVQAGPPHNDRLLPQQPQRVDDDQVLQARRVAARDDAQHVQKVEVEPRLVVLQVGGHVPSREGGEELRRLGLADEGDMGRRPPHGADAGD